MDLMCESTSSYNKIASFYFLGFLTGAITSFLPDMLGRRKVMLFILPVYSIASAMSIFSNSLVIKSIGFFLQGLFHLKISLSYLHVLDLIPESSKSFVYAFITAFDSSTWMIACASF
jgi:MFS family permease